MDNGPVRGHVTTIKNGLVNWSITIESKEKAKTVLVATFTDWQVAGLLVLNTIGAFFLIFSSLEKPLKCVIFRVTSPTSENVSATENKRGSW
jgi:hypothetical protein